LTSIDDRPLTTVIVGGGTETGQDGLARGDGAGKRDTVPDYNAVAAAVLVVFSRRISSKTNMKLDAAWDRRGLRSLMVLKTGTGFDGGVGVYNFL
jgi:hypothetical protein